MFFNSKKEVLFSPANGIVKTLDQVKDPVFSQKMMGDGFAVQPTGKNVYAPVRGVVSNIFPTKHALGIKSEQGLEVLVHMGIDTVDLQGDGFDVMVTEGQQVTEATPLAEVDLEKLRAKGKESDIMVIVTNMDQVKKSDIKITGSQDYKTPVMKVSIK